MSVGVIRLFLAECITVKHPRQFINGYALSKYLAVAKNIHNYFSVHPEKTTKKERKQQQNTKAQMNTTTTTTTTTEHIARDLQVANGCRDTPSQFSKFWNHY